VNIKNLAYSACNCLWD